MKKTIILCLFFIFMNQLTAQVAKYTSYQSAMMKKNNSGEFRIPTEWQNKQMKIVLDLDSRKLQIFSIDFSGVFPTSVDQEIQLITLQAKSAIIGNSGFAIFNGLDNTGNHCVVRFNFKKGVNDIYDGLLQIEYPETQSIYKIRKEPI